MEVCGLHTSGSSLGEVVGPCENGNEHVGCIECQEFLNLLTKCWLCKKKCVRWS